MAAAIERTLESRSHLLVEAGTGVGKSFAYLVPAALRCLRGEVVVIATNTIALQEQLIGKDIPLVHEALQRAGLVPEATAPDDEEDEAELKPEVPTLRPVLVKGRGNYVSIRRLALASQRQVRLFSDAAALRSLQVIEDWATTTLDGTLSTLPTLERPGIWDKVQSDSGNCMGRKCGNYGNCFYQRARRRMESANLLVCNHALFLSDLALRAKEVGFLPEYQHVVLDEAHAVEDVAAEHFGVSLSEGRVMHLLTTLYQSRGAKGYLPHLQLASGELDAVERAVRLTLAAERESQAFFDSLLQVHRSTRGSSGRVRQANVVPNTLSAVMKELSLCLKNLREKVTNEPDKYELNAYAVRAAAIAEEAEVLIAQLLPGCAYWIEVGGDDLETWRGNRVRRVSIACSPIEVAPILKERLFGAKTSVVLTSATLSIGKSDDSGFSHIMSRLGCEGADTMRLGSPFDHASQMELRIERSMPRPDGGRITRQVDEMDQRSEDEVPRRAPFASSGSYNEQLAMRVLSHIDETDGGAFVLFTSFATLNAVANVLGPELESRGMPMFVHGRDGPRTQLLEKFRQDDRSVLLGAASFWQGVDVRGRGLRNVIITRLPFDPPDRPLTEARLERITERGGDPFREESLPRAVIKFKQGFGRLIRSKTDRGRVVVLDPRIVTTGYGKRFLDALPDGVKVIEE